MTGRGGGETARGGGSKGEGMEGMERGVNNQFGFLSTL